MKLSSLCVYLRAGYLVVINHLQGKQPVRKRKQGKTGSEDEETGRKRHGATERSKFSGEKLTVERRQRESVMDGWQNQGRWWNRDGASNSAVRLDSTPTTPHPRPSPLCVNLLLSRWGGITLALHLRFISSDHIPNAWRWISGGVRSHPDKQRKPVAQQETSNPQPLVSQDSIESNWIKINVGARLPSLQIHT